jgi:hypothetical protein
VGLLWLYLFTGLALGPFGGGQEKDAAVGENRNQTHERRWPHQEEDPTTQAQKHRPHHKQNMNSIDEYRKAREAWAKENYGAIEVVKNKLLLCGGTKISPQPQPNIPVLSTCGMLVRPLQVVSRKMHANRCYENVMKLWNSRGPRSTLICHGLGYALSDDGMWRPHHWLFSFTRGKYHIVETTCPWLMYWGLPDGIGTKKLRDRALLLNQLFDPTTLAPRQKYVRAARLDDYEQDA